MAMTANEVIAGRQTADCRNDVQYEIKMTDHEAEGSKGLIIAYNWLDRLNSISFKKILYFNSMSVARNVIS